MITLGHEHLKGLFKSAAACAVLSTYSIVAFACILLDEVFREERQCRLLELAINHSHPACAASSSVPEMTSAIQPTSMISSATVDIEFAVACRLSTMTILQMACLNWMACNWKVTSSMPGIQATFCHTHRVSSLHTSRCRLFNQVCVVSMQTCRHVKLDSFVMPMRVGLCGGLCWCATAATSWTICSHAQCQLVHVTRHTGDLLPGPTQQQQRLFFPISKVRHMHEYPASC